MSAWRWIVENKDLISSIGVIIALIFSTIGLYLTFNPLPHQPALTLFYSSLNLDGSRFFIQNAGQVPCVDLEIQYDGQSKLWLFYHYKDSDVRFAQFSNDSMSYPVPMRALIQQCATERCLYDFYYLDVNEVLPFYLEFKEQKKAYKIDVSCSGRTKSLILDPYCVNPPPFGWCNVPVT